MRRLRRIWRVASIAVVVIAGSSIVRHEIRAHFSPLEIALTVVMVAVFAIAVTE